MDLIDGYLLGPRNPYLQLQLFQPVRMLPARISLKVALGSIEIVKSLKNCTAFKMSFGKSTSYNILPMPVSSVERLTFLR